MKKVAEQTSLFELVRQGLEECLQFTRGELKLRTFEVVQRPPRWNATDVRRFRRQCRMSQGLFASVLNVSVKTVQSWEQGQRRPSQAALRLLQIMSDCPAAISHILNGNTKVR
jgi:putative transcriptional regulator